MNLATIVKIKSFEPIPGKDLIHSVSMEGNGWTVVCKKSDTKIGDLMVFFVIDSIVDKENPAFAFMEPRKFRLHSCKFGGAPSQGLLMPVSILSYYGVDPLSIKEGDDVSDCTKTLKYEKPLDLRQSGDVKGNFPSNLISITDEDNLKSNIKCLDEFLNEEIYLSTKADGSSGTFIWHNGEIHVCSRRLSLKEGDNGWWRMFRKYDLESKFKLFATNIAVQFELCGPKYNGNRLGLKEETIQVFNFKNLETQKYAGLSELEKFCADFSLPMVKVLKVCNFNQFGSIEALQMFANEVKYDNGQPAEGIVIRSVEPKWSYILGKNLSVKLINQSYKE